MHTNNSMSRMAKLLPMAYSIEKWSDDCQTCPTSGYIYETNSW